MEDNGGLHFAALVGNQTLKMKRWNLQQPALEEHVWHREKIRFGDSGFASWFLEVCFTLPQIREPQAAAPRSSKRDLHQQWLAPARCKILATQWPSGFVWKCHDMSGNGGAPKSTVFLLFRFCHEWQHIRVLPVLPIFGQAQVISSPLLG